MKTLRLKNSKTHGQVKKKTLFSIIEENQPFSKLRGLPRKVRLAFLFMEENFYKKVGLKDVAEEVGLKPNSLCKMVEVLLKKKKIHITCMQYIDFLRVKKAMEIFGEDSKIKCKTVAEKIGIGERNQRKVFHKFTGKSPMEFRR